MLQWTTSDHLLIWRQFPKIMNEQPKKSKLKNMLNDISRLYFTLISFTDSSGQWFVQILSLANKITMKSLYWNEVGFVFVRNGMLWWNNFLRLLKCTPWFQCSLLLSVFPKEEGYEDFVAIRSNNFTDLITVMIIITINSIISSIILHFGAYECSGSVKLCTYADGGKVSISYG